MTDHFHEMLEPKVLYQGRLWDAPFTDNAMPADLAGLMCTWCEEIVEPFDDAVKMPNTTAHLECMLCASLGNIAHLEHRCSCFKLGADAHDPDLYISFHDEAKATLRWLVEHKQGRFKPT